MAYTPPLHTSQHWHITKPAASGRKGMVASQARGAAEAGVAILEAGGTAPLSSLPILPASEREQVLHGFQDMRDEWSHEWTVHAVFEERVREQPDAEAVRFGLDNVTIMTFPNDGAGIAATWPFDQPFHLILNIAVGGDWGGYCLNGRPPSFPDDGVQNVMKVDYVRFYANDAVGAPTPLVASPATPWRSSSSSSPIFPSALPTSGRSPTLTRPRTRAT